MVESGNSKGSALKDIKTASSMLLDTIEANEAKKALRLKYQIAREGAVSRGATSDELKDLRKSYQLQRKLDAIALLKKLTGIK